MTWQNVLKEMSLLTNEKPDERNSACKNMSWKKKKKKRELGSNCGFGEDWEFLGLQGDQTIQFYRKSTLNIHWIDNADAETQILWPPGVKSQFIGKNPDTGKDWRQEEKGSTEDEIVGWHHWLKWWVWANYGR